MARQTLGRGLSALLGEDTTIDTRPAGASDIDIHLITPNPEQPRKGFTEKALNELEQSIRENGIVQPIVVRRKGNSYEIVAGERRWRAAQRAGLKTIPAAVKDVSDDKLLELALIENIQRQELNPIEEAAAYRKLIDSVGLTQEAVAQRVGKERTLIATTLRLLKLPDDIQKLIEEDKLSSGHGRALLMTDDPSKQRRIARMAVDKSMSVRETERAVKQASTSQLTEDKGVISTADPNWTAAETKLRRLLSTGVKIKKNTKGKGGKIEIEFYTEQDLDRVYQLLAKS